jgi:hypothetical protein
LSSLLCSLMDLLKTKEFGNNLIVNLFFFSFRHAKYIYILIYLFIYLFIYFLLYILIFGWAEKIMFINVTKTITYTIQKRRSILSK